MSRYPARGSCPGLATVGVTLPRATVMTVSQLSWESTLTPGTNI